MTYAARQVLADCQVALQLLEEETDLQRWRIHWAAAVALTRAVGHILDKVDGNSPKIRTAARAAYGRWKDPTSSHKIFREFIETERNNILKEYRFNLHPLDDVDVVVSMTVVDPLTGEKSEVADVMPLGGNVYRPILDGFGEGDDAREVLAEALEWWSTELDAIDAVVAAGSF
ncbi:MAG: hypothetical protein P4L52_02745 [Acidocella sp.]|nr:hypothetical protein [Acidocella sp.]